MLAALPAHAAEPSGGSAAPAWGVVAGTDSPDAVPGRYIVTMKPGAQLSASAQGLVSGRVSGGQVATTFTAQLSAEEARRVAADPSVGIVEQDRVIRIEATQSYPVWGLDRIDQRSVKRSKTYRPFSDGSTVHAYVIDTGVRIDHVQFGGRATNGYDFTDDDAVAGDCNGHGTHVAGTIGGYSYGVAKRVRLVAVRVLDCRGSGYLSDIIDGVNWVTASAVKPAVANMSLGGPFSASLEYAVQNSINSGITYVVAAGNENRNAYYTSPAGLPAAITVAATTSKDRRAYFSNWGATVDIFAPGVNIKSAYPSSRTATQFLSGTSMAAPHVAGAVAMVLDAAPGFTPRQVRDFLVARSTKGKVTDRKQSPNRLLFVPAPPPSPKIRARTVPIAHVGQPYRIQLSLEKNRRGTWSIAAGSLPAGLFLSASGQIFGTPTTVTPPRAVVVKFTDFVPQAGARQFTLQVQP
ncbi:S8 family peptidase [Jidongwangia harbinensis]|uniref:S8 family peptidase n=1 Tax=Jidongwangia harbinensis TaxID=2878561 RepID=UPI001CDA4B48|nr:S8 family peptidase [Jidongwangia harbinensis]MCA2217697.1 S8 family peptidase [Jidongwangia harbinensis]